MKKSLYLKLQFKRALKIFPVIFIITALMLGAIGIFGASVLKQNNDGSGDVKISVDVVGDIGGTYLGFGVEAFKQMDSSSLYVEFETKDEESAKQALKKGETAGYLFVPENFVSGVVNLENVPAHFVISKTPSDLGALLVKEVVYTASDYVTEVQDSVVNAMDAMKAAGTKDRWTKTEQLNMKYIQNVIGRTVAYNIEYTGVTDSVSLGGYYVCGFVLLFLLMWGISCGVLLTKNDAVMPRMLNSRGLKPGLQVLYEYIVYVTLTLFTLFVFSIVAGIMLGGKNVGIKELQGIDVMFCMEFVWEIIPVILAICAMQLLMYETVTGTVAAVLFQFIVTIGLGYISGCFYPSFFFPDKMQEFAAILPPGRGFAYLRKTMAGSSYGTEFWWLMLYTVVFLLLTVLMRKRRMAGDGQ